MDCALLILEDWFLGEVPGGPRDLGTVHSTGNSLCPL